jgi:putative ABC transport system substrate-binding protein
MNDRRRWLLAASGLLGAAVVRAQPSSPMRRIGLLWVGGPDSSIYVDALKEGLRSHGYIDGKNIHIDKQFLVDGYEQLAEAAARLVKERPDVIVTYGATSSTAAAKATSTIPVVFLLSADPVKLGLAASLSRPGRNATGVSAISQDLHGKRLELLKQAVPGARRIGLVYSSASPNEVAAGASVEKLARELGLDPVAIDIRLPTEIEPVLGKVSRRTIDAFTVYPSTMFTANRTRLARAVEKTGIPAVYANSALVEAGGLISYAPSHTELFRRVASYVDRILKGANPADLPIEQASEVELVINLKAAAEQRIRIPDDLIHRADRLIR